MLRHVHFIFYFHSVIPLLLSIVIIHYPPTFISLEILCISFQFNCSLLDLSPPSPSPSPCYLVPDSIFQAVLLAKIIIIFSNGSFQMKFAYFAQFNCIVIGCKTLTTLNSYNLKWFKLKMCYLAVSVFVFYHQYLISSIKFSKWNLLSTRVKRSPNSCEFVLCHFHFENVIWNQSRCFFYCPKYFIIRHKANSYFCFFLFQVELKLGLQVSPWISYCCIIMIFAK